jgi:zinc/manganese transport system substrate-binding protein
MQLYRRGILAGIAALTLVKNARAMENTGKINVVAAENMYGDIARQIGGDGVNVTSILNNPNEDPHLFSASPSVARDLAHADIVIVNGANYDAWMAPMLAANAGVSGRVVISIADLLGRKPGDNPHLWYDPNAIPGLTARLVPVLSQKDPTSAAVFQANGAKLLADISRIHARMAAMRSKYQGIKVTATEPVFGLMAQALGLVVLNQRFQIAVMNDTEPSPADVGKFEADLRQHRVRALFYNSQVTDNLTTTLLGLAHASNIPVVGVTETEPPGMDYQQWMISGLDGVDRALSPA